MRDFFLARLYLACHEDIYFINKFEFLDNKFLLSNVFERSCRPFTSVSWRSAFWNVVVGVVPSNVIPE